VSSVVTVMNMKGGVGKTTVAMHLAGVFCRYVLGSKKARRVLVIDYDPQFNLSQAFLPPKTYFALEKARKTTLAILLDDSTKLNPYQLQVPGNHSPPKVADVVTRVYAMTNGGYLDLAPSTLDLMYVALGQSSAQLKPMEERFEKFMAECREKYDLVIIDCHPAGSIFTKTSLRNSDHVVIPVVPQRYAVRGIGLMMEFINEKNQGTKGPTPHILFNATARTGTSSEESAIRGNPAFASKCMLSTLHRFSAFSEPEGGTGFVWSSKKPYSKEARRNLLTVTQELQARIGVE
jgi:chromosome partitioning protein